MVPRAKYSLSEQRSSKKFHFPGQSDCFRVGHMSQFEKSGGSSTHLFFQDKKRTFFFSNMHEGLYSLTCISCHVKFMNKTCIKINVLL